MVATPEHNQLKHVYIYTYRTSTCIILKSRMEKKNCEGKYDIEEAFGLKQFPSQQEHASPCDLLISRLVNSQRSQSLSRVSHQAVLGRSLQHFLEHNAC